MKKILTGLVALSGALVVGSVASANTLALGSLRGVLHGNVTIALKNDTLTSLGRWCLTIDQRSTTAAWFIVGPTRGAHGGSRTVSASRCVSLTGAEVLSAVRLDTVALANGTHRLVVVGTSRHAGPALVGDFRSSNTGGYVGSPNVIALAGVKGDTILARVSTQRVGRVVLEWGTPADHTSTVMTESVGGVFTAHLTGVIAHSYLTFRAVATAGTSSVTSPSVVVRTP